MPENIIKDINGMLNEEKWTRATLNDYVVGNFHNLDEIIATIMANELQNDVAILCEEHLEHTKNSIVALYLSGVIALSKQTVDDTYLLNLISIFADNHKWVAVEYLCNRILDFGENKEALRILAETLEHLNRPHDMYEIWERLIKIDYAETDIVKRLASKKEESGNIADAILYYRKAIHRYVNKNQFNHVRDIWKKLVEHGVDDYEFFFLIEKKVAKSMSPERAIHLLESFYPAVKEREKWITAIEVLKRILNYDGRNNWARQEIVECYKTRYANHSQVDECIRLSNLTQNWRNVLEAITDFEKHISFDSGSFVFHKTWGVGIIKEIKDDKITIDFVKKRAHTMSLKMAIGALQSLSRDHIWVLKSIHSKSKLKSKVENDIPWTLRTVIKSFDNVADIKRIKSELVPTLLTPSKWTSWSSEARKILKTNPDFGNVPDKLDQFIIRDKPMSFEEKTFNQFKAEKNFFGKIQSVRDFLDHSDPASEFFAEMFDYFTAFLNAGMPTPQVVASFLFVHKLSSLHPFLNPGLDWGFKELWKDMDDPVEIFSQIEDPPLREYFLATIRKEVEDWPAIYLTLFPIQLSKSMLDELLSAGYKDAIRIKLEEIIEHYREYREGLIWIAQHASENHLFHELDIQLGKVLINMILLLELTFTEIGNRREVSYNKKLNRQIQNHLFKEGNLKTALLNSDENFAMRISTLLEEIDDVDIVVKRDLKSIVREKFPKIKLYDKKSSIEPATTASSRYFYTTQANLVLKQKELRSIIEVEIPKNSKEIGVAIELGDLSENAEYKAGKERQETLQIQAGKLTDEIERARLFSEEDRNNGKIGFGTIITLEDQLEGKEEVYTILGPWESNPSEKTISYLSPFGHAFMGKSQGDILDFKINDREYKYTIKNLSQVELN